MSAGCQTTFVEGPPRLAVDHMGAGPFLMFLHGIGGNRGNWHDQLPVFAGDFHAACWDARGYGDSDDYDGKLEFGAFAGDLVRVLDHFDVERAHLCGLSMGGRILQDFVARFPERVATLVLCGTTPGFDVSMTPEKKAEFVRLRTQKLRDGLEPRDMAPDVVRSLIGPNAPQALFDRAVAGMSRLHKESYIKTVEASLGFNRLADLPNIAVPTLLVYGEHDNLTPPDVGRRMLEEIEGAQMVVIEDSGHLMNIEQPERFNTAVLGFLRAHRDRA